MIIGRIVPNTMLENMFCLGMCVVLFIERNEVYL